MRETALTDERSKLLDLLSAESENVRALLPPADDRKSNWLLRLVGRTLKPSFFRAHNLQTVARWLANLWQLGI